MEIDIIALIIAVIIGCALGFGTSLFIFSGILNKSNNIGDSMGGFDAYAEGDIDYLVKEDEVSKDTQYFFMKYYGRTAQQNTEMMKDLTEEQYDYDNIPPTDTPLFVSNNTDDTK